MSHSFLSIAKKYLEISRVQEIMGVSDAREIAVEFLAQGEYNVNFLLKSPGKKTVLRLNTGSQMHLKNQIRYEFETLKLLEQTGVTAKPYFCDDSFALSPFGMLLMEFVPGRWLEYEKDYLKAVDVFARIHQIGYSENSPLIVADQPAREIFRECQSMATVYLHSPLGDLKIKKLLRDVFGSVQKIIDEYHEPVPWQRLALTNTEVNSSNFLIDDNSGQIKLVDWEKALFSIPAQDLSHFLVPTTTFWKTNFRFSAEQIEKFLKKYAEMSGADYRELRREVDVFWYLTCLRGVSWCSMAFVEYLQPDRFLKNDFAFQKIKIYVTEKFIKEIFLPIL
ncbi:MAG: aminoglycoside phosphotransferase family protein [Calditrichaeota bacterium]|nr:aminoglycoside phosphotransferase family protein [Calditrichota bacterium]